MVCLYFLYEMPKEYVTLVIIIIMLCIKLPRGMYQVAPYLGVNCDDIPLQVLIQLSENSFICFISPSIFGILMPNVKIVTTRPGLPYYSK